MSSFLMDLRYPLHNPVLFSVVDAVLLKKLTVHNQTNKTRSVGVTSIKLPSKGES